MLLATHVVMDNPDCRVYFSGVSYKYNFMREKACFQERAAATGRKKPEQATQGAVSRFRRQCEALCSGCRRPLSALVMGNPPRPRHARKTSARLLRADRLAPAPVHNSQAIGFLCPGKSHACLNLYSSLIEPPSARRSMPCPQGRLTVQLLIIRKIKCLLFLFMPNFVL